jgi:hypothetical protein
MYDYYNFLTTVVGSLLKIIPALGRREINDQGPLGL